MSKAKYFQQSTKVASVVQSSVNFTSIDASSVCLISVNRVCRILLSVWLCNFVRLLEIIKLGIKCKLFQNSFKVSLGGILWLCDLVLAVGVLESGEVLCVASDVYCIQ